MKWVKQWLVFLMIGSAACPVWPELLGQAERPKVLLWFLEESARPDFAGESIRWVTPAGKGAANAWLNTHMERALKAGIKIIAPLYDLAEEQLIGQYGTFELFKSERPLLEASLRYNPDWIWALKLVHDNESPRCRLESWLKNVKSGEMAAHFVSTQADIIEVALDSAWGQAMNHLPKSPLLKAMRTALWLIDGVDSPRDLKQVVRSLKAIPGIDAVQINGLIPQGAVLKVSYLVTAESISSLVLKNQNHFLLQPLSQKAKTQEAELEFKYTADPQF